MKEKEKVEKEKVEYEKAAKEKDGSGARHPRKSQLKVKHLSLSLSKFSK